jgi:hypothetical protein
MYKEEDFSIERMTLEKSLYVLDDLLNDKFDQTWLFEIEKNKFWNLLGLEQEDVIDLKERIFSTIPPENLRGKGVVDNKDIIYKYNSDGFRSDEFTKDHDGLHIVFSGCSETEGVGDNIEKAWSHILYNQISKDRKCSGFFNLAKSGWGYSKIIPNLMIYFKKYGTPDYLFILLPNCQRKIRFDENKNLFFYWQKYPNIKRDKEFIKLRKNISQKEHTSTNYEYYEDFINFLYEWKTFVEFCKTNKIKMFFGAWDNIDRENLSKLCIFDNYINVKSESMLATKKYKDILSSSLSEDNYFLTKRDGHSGSLYHLLWADQFYDEYRRNLK